MSNTQNIISMSFFSQLVIKLVLHTFLIDIIKLLMLEIVVFYFPSCFDI